jgi:DNA segregation ATPase FtsK/SpoIIIE, S-DNA-T family
MAGRRPSKAARGVRPGVLAGVALAAASLLLALAILFSNPLQAPPPPGGDGLNPLLGRLGDWLAYGTVHGFLGRWWSLVLPLIGLQAAWRLLREKSPARVLGRWGRWLLLALAGALTTAMLLPAATRGQAGWLVGIPVALAVDGLTALARGPGAWILILAFDLIVLALVFRWHPGRAAQSLLAVAERFWRWLTSRLAEQRRRFAQRRLARRQARQEARRLAREQARRLEEEARTASARGNGPVFPDPSRDDPPLPADPLPATRAPVEAEESGSPVQDPPADREGLEAAEEEIAFSVTGEVIEREQRFKARRRRELRYTPPSVDLLANPPADEYHVTDEDMRRCSEELIGCLADFNVEARVVHVHPGPVITRYDIEPAAGVKVSRIAALADDLALKLRAERIRIIAPVPGKGAVGVELPNKVRNTVYLKSIVNTEKFAGAASPLTVALGKTSSGEAAVADLRAMPHILIAGQTGAGKSVCINGIICSILLRALPTEVQFVLVDPKMIELADYKRIAPHFIAQMEGIEGEVVTNPFDAVKVLAALEREMDDRYRFLSQTGYRSIQEFNEALEAGEIGRRIEAGDLWFDGRSEEDPLPDKLVYLVIIIDELADLMMTAGKEIEISIARLAQKARAVGIHLVVATQRPSVDVLTGLIKANFPARIAFAVRQKVDSKTIIDSMGADQLLGRGDMLYLASGSPEPVRMHNALITGREIRALLDHIRRQSLDFPKFRLPVEAGEERSFTQQAADRDELFWDAAEQVIRSGQGSISVLQRRLRIGHSRASRLIDELEIAGVVGPFDGSKARQVLVDLAWLEDRRDDANHRDD